MYIYWPVVLLGLTVVLVFLPARVLFHRSRKWFAFSNVSDEFGDYGHFDPTLLTGAVASFARWHIPSRVP